MWEDGKGLDEFGELDRFITSKLYADICFAADEGDKDSIEVMEDVANFLSNLIFHLENNSDMNRISYEFHQINKFVARWGDFV